MQGLRSDTVPGLEQVIADAIRQFQPVDDAGIALAVIKDGAVCYTGGFGLRDRGSAAKVGPDTFFAIGSATKAFTSMVACVLAAEGKFALDVPVKQYLPDFRMKDGQATDGMTLEDILCHRTGLPRYDALWYLGPFDRSQLFYRLQYLEPRPGPAGGFRRKFEYNNMMYMVAGFLMESLLGETWEDIVRTRIFNRLGMSESSFTLGDLLKKDDYAKGYEVATEVPLKGFENIGPAAAINSNALEMAKWMLLLLGRGTTSNGTAIIGSRDFAAMLTSRIRVKQGLDYALGWYLSAVHGKRLVLHDGDADGCTAYVSFLPDDGAAVVALTNQQGTASTVGRWPDNVVAAIYDHLLSGALGYRTALPVELSRRELFEAAGSRSPSAASSPGDYTGMFSDPGFGDISVSLSGHGLYINYYTHRWPLEPVLTDGFNFQVHAFGMDFDVPVFYKRDNGGKIIALTLTLRLDLKPVRFVKR